MIRLYYAYFLFTIIPILVWSVYLVYRRKNAPGATAFMIVLAGNMWWTLCYALHLAKAVQPIPYFWMKLMFEGVVVVPAALLIFTLQYTNRTIRIRRRYVVLLLIEPILISIAMWTDPLHGLFSADPLVIRPVFVGGIFFWLHSVYSYVLITISAGILFWHALSTRALFRKQSILVILGVIIPSAANAISILKFLPQKGIDLSSLGLSLSGFVLAYAIYRRHLFDLVPVAMENIIKELRDGLLVIDLQTRVVEFNPAANKLLGLDSSSLLGMPADKAIRFWDRIACLLEKNTEAEEEVLLEHKEPRCLNVRIRPIHDNLGQKSGWLLVIQDITERKQIQEKVSQLKSLESMGILAGGIAHDFNNILTIIQGCLELIETGILKKNPVMPYLEAAKKAVGDAEQLTARFITFSPGGSPYRQPCDIGRLVHDMVEKTVAARPVTVELSIDDDLWKVSVDEAQMRQVIGNIVENALEAMPGGGSLMVTGRNINIPAQHGLISSPGPYVHLSFEDTGAGIKEKNMPRIFDPYFSTKHLGVKKGMGLGLAVCHSVVTRHEGFIYAESKESAGCILHVYLPSVTKSDEVSPGATRSKAN